MLQQPPTRPTVSQSLLAPLRLLPLLLLLLLPLLPLLPLVGALPLPALPLTRYMPRLRKTLEAEERFWVTTGLGKTA